MRITVDHREAASGIIDSLQKQGLDVEVQSLSFGDYLINDTVTVERKTDSDFLVSIIDGRLFAQVAVLKKKCDFPLVLIEGNPFKTNIAMNDSAIRGAILSIQSVWYVPVLYSRCKEETCDILVTIAKQRAAQEEELTLRHGYRPKRLNSKQLYVLQGLPNVGPVLAKRLLGHFKTVKNVMAATESELMEIEGIGLGLATKILNVLN